MIKMPSESLNEDFQTAFFADERFKKNFEYLTEYLSNKIVETDVKNKVAGGETFIPAAFAPEHAKRNSMRRVIYTQIGLDLYDEVVGIFWENTEFLKEERLVF